MDKDDSKDKIFGDYIKSTTENQPTKTPLPDSRSLKSIDQAMSQSKDYEISKPRRIIIKAIIAHDKSH